MRHPDPFDPLYAILEKANPNPQREGCVPDVELRRLARLTAPPDSPEIAHVTQCFPCYRQFGLYRAELLRSQRWSRALAIAAALVLSLAGLLWWIRDRTEAPPVITNTPERRESFEPARAALVDLRRFTVARSEEAKGSAARVVIGRGRVSATIYLPVGSPAGAYNLQILTPSLASVVSSKAAAEIRDGLTIIATELDLSRIAPGPYQLALRLGDQDWRFYPVQIE